MDSVGKQAAVPEQPMAPVRSNHIIDLRDASPKTDSRPTPPPLPAPAPERHPVVPPEPEPQPPAAVAAPVRRRVREPDMDTIALPAARRRFWPAFIRFLLLLIILAVIVAGGIYIYNNYYGQ